jgi:class 3 adenylate cyclase/tetratricopeptide (TPR) repeat protein
VPRAIRRRLDDDVHGAEHRRTTVCFIHVGGVDALLRGEGPDAVAAQLDAVVRVAVAAADEHEVSLLATDVAGGGIKLILTAGAPDAVEDSEGRMLAVGRAILDADLGMPVRVGVNTGHVFAGEVGATWRRVYTVMGDAVNLSARLMSKARPGEMVASQVTLEHSATPFELTPLEPFMVKGKRHPQHASSVGRRIEGRGRAASAATFLGRDAELAALLDALDETAADSGAGRVVAVVGEPGIGKSRLVHELIDRAGDVRVVRLTCEPFAMDRPFFMSRVLLRAGLRIDADLSPADAGEALLEWLRTNAADWLEYAPLIGAAMDAEVPSTRTVDDLGADYRITVLRTAAAAVLRIAYDQRVLFVVEDAMWMDEASAHVVAKALEGVADTRWFTLLTSRDLDRGLSTRLGFEAEVVRLTALDAALAVHLAAEITDDAGIPESDLLELCARANGNPLFLLELAHARRELGSLDAIPGSLEDLIGARIDRLSPADRDLLRHVAVLGDRFSAQLFERTLGSSFPTPVSWGRLGDFVVADQGEFRFTHDLVRRVAYAGLPFRRRRELHLRTARALVPRSGRPDDARLGLLALHFDGSGDHLSAWTYNRMAGVRAREKYATVEATGFFERALHNARATKGGVPDDELAEAYEELADVALLAGRYELVREGLRHARRQRTSDALVSARLCRKEGKLRERLGRHSAAQPWFRKGLHFIEDADGVATREVEAERARLLLDWAGVHMWRQQFRSGAQRCIAALPHAIAAGDRKEEAHAYYLLEWALGELGDPEADRYRTMSMPIFEELGDYVGLGAVLINRGVDQLTAGRWNEAIDSFMGSRAAYQRGGDVVSVAQAGHNLADVLVDQGRYEEAENYLRESRRIWRASGFALGVAAVANGLGRAVGRAGRTDEGVQLLDEAIEGFSAVGHTPYVAESKARRAEVLLFGRRWQDALDAATQLGEAAADGGPPVVALSARVKGVALARLGDLAGATAALTEARHVGEHGGVDWEAALAAMELARLGGVDPEISAECASFARPVFARLGIDESRVLPPLA